MKKMRIAIQMDPLEKLHKPFDSTLYLARAAALRGYELFHYEPRHLRMETGDKTPRITARGHVLEFRDTAPDKAWNLGGESVRDLAAFDVILMRQDPPFDLAYIAATHILEHLKNKVKIINDPTGVRNAPEKLLITHFPRLMPPTLITRDREAIESFRAAHGDIIFKPLYGHAGYGIFHVRKDDGNLPALLEIMGSRNAEPWMIQKYLPAIGRTGDKRIVLLDGEPVGIFTRMPAGNDGRGNLRAGAKPKRAALTKRDREICRILTPVLRQRGLFLVGLDVIGDYLTEINVTSPTGLAIADQLEKRTGKNSIAEMFWRRVTAL